MTPETIAALNFAAAEIERELICCPGEDAADADQRHQICVWGLAARRIVLDVAAGERRRSPAALPEISEAHARRILARPRPPVFKPDPNIEGIW